MLSPGLADVHLKVLHQIVASPLRGNRLRRGWANATMLCAVVPAEGGRFGVQRRGPPFFSLGRVVMACVW